MTISWELIFTTVFYLLFSTTTFAQNSLYDVTATNKKQTQSEINQFCSIYPQMDFKQKERDKNLFEQYCKNKTPSK